MTDLPSREASESVAALLRGNVDALPDKVRALVYAHRTWLYGGPPARAGYFSATAIREAKWMTVAALALPALEQVARESRLEDSVAARRAAQLRRTLELGLELGLKRRLGRRLTRDERKLVDAMQLPSHSISTGRFKICRCNRVFEPGRPDQQCCSEACRKIRPVTRPPWCATPGWVRRIDEATYRLEFLMPCQECGQEYWGRPQQRYCAACGSGAARVRRHRRAA